MGKPFDANGPLGVIGYDTVYLARDGAGFMHGSVCNVDGGRGYVVVVGAA